MSELERYTKAMIAGNSDECVAIEDMLGLYGYPPEIVTFALKAVDAGLDPEIAVHNYLLEQPQ